MPRHAEPEGRPSEATTRHAGVARRHACAVRPSAPITSVAFTSCVLLPSAYADLSRLHRPE
jgi:hypothetical protein